MTIATLLQKVAGVDLRQPLQYTPCGLPCSECHLDLSRIGCADLLVCVTAASVSQCPQKITGSVYV